MTDDTDNLASNAFAAYNYCVSFIDLLGQRDALKDEGLLKAFESDTEEKRFINTLKESIGAITKLQSRADDLLREAQKDRPNSPFRATLSQQQQTIWDEMLRERVSTQRWSDGLVSFVNLGDQTIKCHLNGVFNLFATAGSLCFMGLASRKPIRGAIDIAWGMELHPGELYGAAVARAYELESIVAQYPRIVVGTRAIQFLDAHGRNPEQDVYSANNRALAQLCLGMLARDTDGVWILHYLGDDFRNAVSYDHHNDLYAESHAFVREQLGKHQEAADSKLAFRYAHLLSYFEAHRPNKA
ncbi:MAG: hypothetical protein GXP14_15270 [Gammaproteobacteria bacterium]|nr:hypothetical protein [Gammaproteobacteria bacterium]